MELDVFPFVLVLLPVTASYFHVSLLAQECGDLHFPSHCGGAVVGSQPSAPYQAPPGPRDGSWPGAAVSVLCLLVMQHIWRSCLCCRLLMGSAVVLHNAFCSVYSSSGVKRGVPHGRGRQHTCPVPSLHLHRALEHCVYVPCVRQLVPNLQCKAS